jgi:hypothetical protein
MIAAIEAGDFETAAQEGMDSLWFKQVGNRAVRLMVAMQDGTW